MNSFTHYQMLFLLQGFPIFNSPIKARMYADMNETTDSLNLTIKQLAGELRLLEKRLRVEPDPSADALTELRHALDDARLTAWSVSTLITAGRASHVRNAALAFVAAERIRSHKGECRVADVAGASGGDEGADAPCGQPGVVQGVAQLGQGIGRWIGFHPQPLFQQPQLACELLDCEAQAVSGLIHVSVHSSLDGTVEDWKSLKQE